MRATRIDEARAASISAGGAACERMIARRRALMIGRLKKAAFAIFAVQMQRAIAERFGDNARIDYIRVCGRIS